MTKQQRIDVSDATEWRISTVNGVLLAAYFVPTWIIVALRIMISPIHGFYERPNISVALFVSDHLQLAALGTVRFAWLLALGKLTVAGFFALFLVFVTRNSAKNPATVSLPSASSQAKRTVPSAASCRWSLTNNATEILGRS